MVLVFAKYNTNEKILMEGDRSMVPFVKNLLNQKYGGDWLFVETVKPGEILRFEDENIYNGFKVNIERYANIEKIN